MSPYVAADGFDRSKHTGIGTPSAAPAFANERLRAVFDAMSEGLVIHGVGGEILEANRAAQQVLGLTRDQILGKTSLDPLWRAVHEDGSAFAGEAHPAVVTLRTGEPIRGAIMGVRIDGLPDRWISINTEPLFEGDGATPTGVVATFVDVTAERRVMSDLRQARADLAAILEHVPARITAWNRDHTNRFSNAHALREWRLPPGGAVGHSALEIIGPDRYARALPFIQAALAGTPQTHEQIDRQPDGSSRFSLVTYVPKIRDGQVVGLYVLGFDTTPLRHAQDELRIANAQLSAAAAAARDSEHRLRIVANGVPMAIVLFDMEDRILFANDELGKLSPKVLQPEGKTAKEVIPPELHAVSADARARARVGETVRFQVKTNVGGAVIMREVTYSPFRGTNGEIQGVYALGYDITELHDSRERVRDLANRLADVREGEKVALSTTLHERIAQELFAARLGLEQLAKGSGDDPRRKGLIAEVASAIEHTVGELRRMTNELVPVSISNLPLATTLRIHVEEFSARHGVEAKFEVKGGAPDAAIEVRLLLFRALQQILADLREHAQADSVRVALLAAGSVVTLTVVGNGPGVERPAAAEAGSHGLLFLAERLRSIGGRLEVVREDHGATSFTVSVPANVARQPATEAPPHLA